MDASACLQHGECGLAIAIEGPELTAIEIQRKHFCSDYAMEIFNGVSV